MTMVGIKSEYDKSICKITYYKCILMHLMVYKASWVIYCQSNSSWGLVDRVFANIPEDWRSIPGRVIPKTQKMVLDSALLNTQSYNVQTNGKVLQSKERSSALLYISGAFEKGAFGSLSTTIANFSYF